MKRIIRVILCLASICMILGNLHTSLPALIASILFLIANAAALIYNEIGKIRNIKDLQTEMIKVWNEKNLPR